MCKQTSTTITPQCAWLSVHIIRLRNNKRNKTQLSLDIYIWNRQHMMVQPPQAHNHEKYDNNGKVDTYDLMMIIRWVTNISSRSIRREWASSPHSIPHISKKIGKVTKRKDWVSRQARGSIFSSQPAQLAVRGPSHTTMALIPSWFPWWTPVKEILFVDLKYAFINCW